MGTMPQTEDGAVLAALADEVTTLVAAGRPAHAASTLTAFALDRGPSAASLLAQGLAAYLDQDAARAVGLFNQARQRLAPAARPDLDSLYSVAYLNAQLSLADRDRPATSTGSAFYAGNLAALRDVDAPLAREIDASTWPRDLLLVDFWGELCLCSSREAKLYVKSGELTRQIAAHLTTREPITFGGVGTGQEVAYCLDRQVDLLHGMCRPHYLFEARADRLRAFLHLRDFGAALRCCALILFGGNQMGLRARKIFGSLRYAPPSVVVGDAAVIEGSVGPVVREIAGTSAMEPLRAYYASSAFRRRQRRIASGEILPRILVNTCRWTTFLKYCAADFEKAFTTLGCPTRFVIEENDVQTLLPAFYWRELAAFRPDAIFMVSHARPSMPQLPRELPFLSYVQDKCGPLLTHAKLAEHTSGEDLFICLSADHQLFLTAKGVPAAQTFVMPVPVDELMFHPLPADHLRGPEYTVDTSFVKHGTPHAADALAGFLSRATGGIPSGSSRQELTRLFEELYRASCLNVETCWYEADLKRFVADRLSPSVNDQLRHFLDQLVAAFYTTVYSPAWRYQFLEALDEAGIELALYGRNWAQNKRLLHLDRGPVDRERQLNYVYNFTRVNLSINHALSMTPRLVECALAGGFCMVAAHPADRDSLPADAYFEPEKELVRFTTPRDLVDRCRHYLAHPEERRDIACAIRERALAERTCSAGARTVLARWRTLLRGRQATP